MLILIISVIPWLVPLFGPPFLVPLFPFKVKLMFAPSFIVLQIIKKSSLIPLCPLNHSISLDVPNIRSNPSMSFLTPPIISTVLAFGLNFYNIIRHFKILYSNSVLKISDFRRSYPSDLRKKILISDFRVPTFEPVSISDSSDFQHL